jgi:hypothetical protein
MNKLQRGASVAFVVAVMAGVSFSFSTVVSMASNTGSTSITPAQQEALYKYEGYRVIFERGQGTPTEQTFNTCSNPQDYILVDNNWNITHSAGYTKIICR